MQALALALSIQPPLGVQCCRAGHIAIVSQYSPLAIMLLQPGRDLSVYQVSSHAYSMLEVKHCSYTYLYPDPSFAIVWPLLGSRRFEDVLTAG